MKTPPILQLVIEWHAGQVGANDHQIDQLAIGFVPWFGCIEGSGLRPSGCAMCKITGFVTCACERNIQSVFAE